MIFSSFFLSLCSHERDGTRAASSSEHSRTAVFPIRSFLLGGSKSKREGGGREEEGGNNRDKNIIKLHRERTEANEELAREKQEGFPDFSRKYSDEDEREKERDRFKISASIRFDPRVIAVILNRFG